MLAPLFVEDVTVRPGGLPQSVSVFTEGATLRSSIAPTHALAVTPAADSGISGPFTVPPEAVEIAFDPERFTSDFHVLNGEEIVDTVVIRNTLPTTDDQRGAFDYLEISIASRIAGASDADTATAGPFRLSATGTRGGEITLPMLRLARGERQVTVSGRAYYAGGSYRTFDADDVRLAHHRDHRRDVRGRPASGSLSFQQLSLKLSVPVSWGVRPRRYLGRLIFGLRWE